MGEQTVWDKLGRTRGESSNAGGELIKGGDVGEKPVSSWGA